MKELGVRQLRTLAGTAVLPSEVVGHLGAQLRRFVLAQHHRRQDPDELPRPARAGHTDYVIHAAALAAPLIARLAAHPQAHFADPTPRRRWELCRRLDRIFSRRTGFATLGRLLARLHTNGSGNDIRCQATKRKASGGTRSDNGRDCRNAFLGLAKIGQKLKIAFWDCLGSRCNAPTAKTIPLLSELVVRRCIAQP